MIEGIFDISNDGYHEMEGISRSAISELKKSPLHYWEKFINPERCKDKKTSPAMAIGSAVHCLVMEPEKFDLDFAIEKKVDGRTNSGKEYKSKFSIENKGKTIIGEDDYSTAKNISAAIIDHPKAYCFMTGDFCVEKSLFWIDKDSGMRCKARPDIWNKSLNLICDIKTTRDASAGFFSRSAIDHDYHIQAAMQIDAVYELTGEIIEYFTFIAAPNDPPHRPYIYNLSKDAIEAGRKEYKEALIVIKECMRRNKWTEDRDSVCDLFFSDYQLNSRTIQNLSEIYQCQI